MMQKKMELGIMTKAPEQFEVTGNLSVSKLLSEDTDEQTKAKIGLLAGKLLQVISKTMDEQEKNEYNKEDEEE